MLRMRSGIVQDTMEVVRPAWDANVWRIPGMWKTIGWLSAMTLSFIGLLVAMAIGGLKAG